MVTSARGVAGSPISYGVAVSLSDSEELKLFLENDARELSKSDPLDLTLLPPPKQLLEAFSSPCVAENRAELARKAVELFRGCTIIGTEVLGRCM